MGGLNAIHSRNPVSTFNARRETVLVNEPITIPSRRPFSTCKVEAIHVEFFEGSALQWPIDFSTRCQTKGSPRSWNELSCCRLLWRCYTLSECEGGPGCECNPSTAFDDSLLATNQPSLDV